MKLLRAAIIFTLTIIAFTLSVGAQDESRATKTWDVEKYDITTTLPQSESDRNVNINAVLNLKNVSSSPASTLTLRISQNANVSDVKVNNATADFSKREEKISEASSLQKIIVRLPSTQPNAILNVAVDYKLNVKENTGVIALSPIGSQFLPTSFWYPTPTSWFFARGADYAPFSLKINAANGLTALSSGSTNTTAGGSGNSQTFEQKLNGQPFFLTGNWDAVTSNEITVYLPKGAGGEEKQRAEEVTSLAAEAKIFVGSLLGTAPNVPLKIISVSRGAGFSGGGTMFVEDSLFRRQKIDSQTATSIAESVARIWLGNSVSVDGEAYGVIREGLPRYIATQFLEKKFGKEIADIERLRQRTAYAAVSKRDSPLNISSPLDDYYYASVANKGAMLWRLLANKVGQEDFYKNIRSLMSDGELTLSEVRTAFPSQKALLDYEIDDVLDMNLLVGLPQISGAETKSALRNTGAIEVTVDVAATTALGEKSKTQVTIPAKGFSEVSFKTASKIVRTEIDVEKLYPQTEYTDDIVPRESDDSDAILNIKRAYDKQDYATAEKNARATLQLVPRFDDARTWLGRALLAQGKNADAEKEFRAVLEEKLPTSRSLAWANVGLGDIALKTDQKAQAAKYFEEAVKADAEYGATLAARQGRNKLSSSTPADESITAFFVKFDKAAISGRKADLDALIIAGEISRFAGGVAGAQEWQTKILQIDKIDANNASVETALTIRLLNKNEESGTAVFQLSKVNNGWRLNKVEMFEVR